MPLITILKYFAKFKFPLTLLNKDHFKFTHWKGERVEWRTKVHACVQHFNRVKIEQKQLIILPVANYKCFFFKLDLWILRSVNLQMGPTFNHFYFIFESAREARRPLLSSRIGFWAQPCYNNAKYTANSSYFLVVEIWMCWMFFLSLLNSDFGSTPNMVTRYTS